MNAYSAGVTETEFWCYTPRELTLRAHGRSKELEQLLDLFAWHGSIVANTSMGTKKRYTPKMLLGKQKSINTKAEYEALARNKRREHVDRMLEEEDYGNSW